MTGLRNGFLFLTELSLVDAVQTLTNIDIPSLRLALREIVAADSILFRNARSCAPRIEDRARALAHD